MSEASRRPTCRRQADRLLDCLESMGITRWTRREDRVFPGAAPPESARALPACRRQVGEQDSSPAAFSASRQTPEESLPPPSPEKPAAAPSPSPWEEISPPPFPDEGGWTASDGPPPGPPDPPLEPPPWLTDDASMQEDTAPMMDNGLARLDWDGLQARVAACVDCPLHANRRQTVFGVGNPRAEWMLVGEGPGEEEDKQGKPFVGRAGQLLDNMLQAIGFDRETVYIGNVVKCRPPANRNPTVEEMGRCGPYLDRQIDLIQPRLLIALGRVASQYLLHSDKPMRDLRGQVHYYGPRKIPLIVTYHPAYLLRRPLEKRKSWQDLQFICATSRQLGGPPCPGL